MLKNKETMPTIIYIAGYGRSGSTILDILLGNSPQAISLGEIGQLWIRPIEDEVFCSCGKKVHYCDYWRSISEHSKMSISIYNKIYNNSALNKKIESWSSFFNIINNKNNKSKQLYSMLMKELFKNISSSNDVRILIDSSKSSYGFMWRYLALKKIVGLDIKVIHLTRNLRAVINSKTKGNNRNLAMNINKVERFIGVRTIIGWLIANFSCSIGRLFFPSSSWKHISYEFLMDEPVKCLQSLEVFCNLDLTSSIDCVQRGSSFPEQHLIGGNRLAKTKRIIFRISSN